MSGLLKECAEKYAKLRAAGDSASNGDRESTAAVCKNAIEKSGLTTKEFAEKYGLDKLPYPTQSTPKTQPSTSDLEAAIHQCLIDWRNYAETSSAACAQALAASGLPSEDFWKKFEAWAVQQPYGDQTTDVDALVKECFAKYTAKDPTTLETCKKAMAASGLSGDAFWDKYGRPTPPSTEPKPSTKPSSSTELYQLMALCFKLHSAITPTTEKSQIDAAYDACNKAIALSGLSVNDFWAKYAKELAPSKPSTTPTASPKPVTNPDELAGLIAKCVDAYKNVKTTGDTKTVTELCKAAIVASGLSSNDFWSKYNPYVTH